jgi:hypothetical protein
MTQLSYFAKDGNYGDASGVVVLDTTKWTSNDFDLLEQVDDVDRPMAARLIQEWIDEDRSDKYDSYFERMGIERGES